MAHSDPIADMLTRIRNAVRNHAPTVNVKQSKVCTGIAGALKDEGYIIDFDSIEDGHQGLIRIKLKYGQRGEDVIHQIKRVSKPGCRVYRGVADLPRPMDGLGISIVSTSSGVLSDRQARAKRMGGELLCVVD
jgi:small subunit ribosomal protein S8